MSWEECKIILCYGFPAAIQTIIFAMISSVLGKMITVYGNTYIGIQRVATQIESVAYMTANAFQVAMTSFVAQNFGAGKDKRIRDGYRVGIYLMLVLGVLTTLLFICEGRPLIKLFFTDSLAVKPARIIFESSDTRRFSTAWRWSLPEHTVGLANRSYRRPAALSGACSDSDGGSLRMRHRILVGNLHFHRYQRDWRCRFSLHF